MASEALEGRTVAPGIVVVETKTADGKIGAVLGERVALAVDAGLDGDEGRRLADVLRDLCRRSNRLAYTHGHSDHVLGGEPWIGGEVYAHIDAAAHIKRQVPGWAERFGRTEDEVTGIIAWPTVRFSERLVLDLGGREVQLVPTPGHAPGAVCVFVPDGRALFGGDTVVTGIPPAFFDGDSGALERTLRELVALDAHVLVPGHGDVVEGAAEVRDAIAWSADYLARCREHVLGRHGREPLDAIVAAAPYGAYIGDRLPTDRNHMAWRHEQTIRAIARELDRLA